METGHFLPAEFTHTTQNFLNLFSFTILTLFHIYSDKLFNTFVLKDSGAISVPPQAPPTVWPTSSNSSLMDSGLSSISSTAEEDKNQEEDTKHIFISCQSIDI